MHFLIACSHELEKAIGGRYVQVDIAVNNHEYIGLVG